MGELIFIILIVLVIGFFIKYWFITLPICATLVITVVIYRWIVAAKKKNEEIINSSKPEFFKVPKVTAGQKGALCSILVKSLNEYLETKNYINYLEKVKQWHMTRAKAYNSMSKTDLKNHELNHANRIHDEIEQKKKHSLSMEKFPEQYLPITENLSAFGIKTDELFGCFRRMPVEFLVSEFFHNPYYLCDSQNEEHMFFFRYFVVVLKENNLYTIDYANVDASVSKVWGDNVCCIDFHSKTSSYYSLSFRITLSVEERDKICHRINDFQKRFIEHQETIDYILESKEYLIFEEAQGLALAEREKKAYEAQLKEKEQAKLREIQQKKRREEEEKQKIEERKREEAKRRKLEEALKKEKERQAAEEAERKRKAEELALRRKREEEERRKEAEARRAEEERIKRELAEKQERERQERLYEINKAKNAQYEVREDMPLYLYLDISEPENTNATPCNSLDFKPRFLNALREHNCDNMYALLSYSLADLISWDNLGRVTITHAIQEIERFYKGVVTFEAPEQTRTRTRNRSNNNSPQFSDEEIRMIMEARKQKEAERERLEAEAKERALKLLTNEVTSSPIVQYGGSNVITNNIFNLTFVQKDNVEAELYELVFVSELGDEVSSKVECPVVKQGEKFDAYFELVSNISFDSSKMYYLLIKNKGDDSLIGKIDYKIDISFASDFDF